MAYVNPVEKAVVKYKNLDRKVHVVNQDLNNALNSVITAVNDIPFKGKVFSSKYAPKNSQGEDGDIWIQLP